MLENKRIRLIFYSADNRSHDSDLQIDVNGPSMYSVELLRTNYTGNGPFRYERNAYNERMGSMLSHLNRMRANQLHKNLWLCKA